MSCEVAALPFQAHANYGTWSYRKVQYANSEKEHVDGAQKNIFHFGGTNNIFYNCIMYSRRKYYCYHQNTR